MKAHLAILAAMEPLEMEPFGAAALPPLKPTSDEANAGQDGTALEERDRSPIARSGMEPAERGSGHDGKTLRPGAG